MRNRLLLTFILSFVVANATGSANDSSSQDALTIEMKEMAKDFAAIVEKKGGGALAVGEFSASSDVRASAGPRIQLALVEVLKALRVKVDADNYRFEIKGDYQPITDKETGLLGIRVLGRLIDRETADVLAEKPTGRFVFGTQTVPEFLGMQAHVSPNANAVDASDEFKRALKDPSAHIETTRIRTTVGSPYAIELLVKAAGKYSARKVTTDNKGRPMVSIEKQEVYGVRLFNDSKFEAAVDLRIDGINCFEFSETKAKFWIVPPGKHVDVLGWHKTNQTTLEFKVVDFPDTAAEKLKLKPSATIGLITASFSASWKDEKDRPRDEPTGRGTGFGSEITVKTQQVNRTIGHPRDTISIRYER